MWTGTLGKKKRGFLGILDKWKGVNKPKEQQENQLKGTDPFIFKTRDQAKSSLFEYIELFYNRQLRHSYLGYKSPVEFERTALKCAN